MMAIGEIFQLLMFLVDLTPSTNVDEEGDDDDDPAVLLDLHLNCFHGISRSSPNRPVEGRDAEDIPARADPAP